MGGRPLNSYIGEKYGCLTITGVDYVRTRSSSYGASYVFADCDCGVCGKSYNLNKLKRGETKSCGHLTHVHGRRRKFNVIEYGDDYGVIFTSDGTPFYFDLEDEIYLNGKYWYKDDYGYLTHAYTVDCVTHYERFHRIVLCAQPNEFVDHISRDKQDNRKCNLRICSHRDNDINRDPSVSNHSGIIGVSWIPKKSKWRSSITDHGVSVHLGYFDNFDDAVQARLYAEKERFGEYSPQRHLFIKYGITEVV